MSKITIHTLARDLNLSPGTISKIINNKSNASEETKERVLSHIEKIGYVPSSSARMLKSKRTYTIGIIFSEDLQIGLEHPFFSSILQHFKNRAEDKGYELSFIVRKLGKNIMSYYEWCLNKRVDGVYIVVGNYNDLQLLELVNSNIPCVSTDMIMDNLHTVVSDNYQGIDLTLSFIKNDLGLTNVSYIAGPQNSKAFKERLLDFKELTKKYRLNVTSISEAEGFGFNSGYNAALEIIKGKYLPEIIIAGSDDLALGLLKALADNHISVPNEIQVIGFDDIEFSKRFVPPLTTIRQDRKRLGEVAADDLIEIIESGVKNNKTIERIPVELIARQTTKIK